jgi:hypothetical protein
MRFHGVRNNVDPSMIMFRSNGEAHVCGPTQNYVVNPERTEMLVECKLCKHRFIQRLWSGPFKMKM